jgi:hypothetical protein
MKTKKYHTVGTFVYKSKMKYTIYLLMSLEHHLAVGNDILTPSTYLFNYCHNYWAITSVNLIADNWHTQKHTFSYDIAQGYHQRYSQFIWSLYSTSMSRKTEKAIIRFGPYGPWGRVKHRTERLGGLISKLFK